MAKKAGEHIGATDPNDELIEFGKTTALYFAEMLKEEQNNLDKIRTDIIGNKDTASRLNNMITRDEHRVRLGEQRIAVWEFALVKAKALGELTKSPS